MAARSGIWLALLALAGGATAQDAPPDEAFVAFLGGLDADGEWPEFFDAVPDDPPPAVIADIAELGSEDEAD